MKFREKTVKYDIDKHGSAYVDYTEPIYICPECSSSEAKLKEGCSSTYVCQDCGCEFRAWHEYVPESAAKRRYELYLKARSEGLGNCVRCGGLSTEDGCKGCLYDRATKPYVGR